MPFAYISFFSEKNSFKLIDYKYYIIGRYKIVPDDFYVLVLDISELEVI